MKNRFLLLFLVFGSMLLLFGCGSAMPKELKVDKVTENSLYIKADGTAQVAYLSDFKESYYNAEELKSFIFNELQPYNEKYGEGSAEISELTEDGGVVKVILTFKDSKAFVDFSKHKSNTPIRYPSFAKISEEYGELVFQSASEEGAKKGIAAIDKENDNVLVVSGPVLLLTEKKIKYYSAGRLVDKHHIRLDDKDEAVVVFAR